MAAWLAENTANHQIYFVADESAIKIDDATLIQLVKQIHQIADPLSGGSDWSLEKFPTDEKWFVKHYLEKIKKEGQYIPGKIWIHPDLEILKRKIAEAFLGKRLKITQTMPAIR